MPVTAKAPVKKAFTTGMVAKICKVAPRTVSKWFDTGRLKGYVLPGSLDRRIPRENLIRFLKDHDMPLGSLEEEELKKVLLIGTENLFTDVLRSLLPASDSYILERAGSGFHAGTLAQSFRPAAVVIDLSMGRGDSIIIAQSLRLNPDHKSTLIVALAGEDDADPDSLLACGFDAVFKRPVGADAIADAVRASFVTVEPTY